MPQARYTTEQEIEEMRMEILREKQKMQRGHGNTTGEKGFSKRRLAVKVTSWTLFLSAVILLISAIVSINVAKSKGQIPSFLGIFQLYVVESGSMKPTFDIGTVILCRISKEPQSLKENDIVTFKTLSGAIVTHRIVEVIAELGGGTAYRTKGDNPENSEDTELLTPDRIIAIFVAKIPLT